MTTSYKAIMALSIALFSISACTQQSTLSRAPGTYERTAKTTDAAGTTTESKVSEKVTVDSEGNKTAVVKTKKTIDPKGLFNKTTTQTKVVEDEERY
jgi:hypothetical protein